MRFMNRALALSYFVAMGLSAGGGTLRAQAASAEAGQVKPATLLRVQWLTCRDNYKWPGAYSHCALRIERRELRQGDNHVVVARGQPFRPLKLEKFVVGDTALRYAKSYHRAEMWHSGLVGAGAVLVGGAIASRYLCPTESAMCISSSDRLLSRASTLYAGAGLLAVSIPFRIGAYRASHRAIDTFNASLGR